VYDPKYRSYDVRGEWHRVPDSTRIEITELPIKTWIDPYLDFLEELTRPTDKRKEVYVTNFQYIPCDGVQIVVDLTEEAFNKSDDEITKILRLNGSVSMNNLVAFNTAGQLTLYNTPEAIIEEFFETRMKMYRQRKSVLEQEMDADLELLEQKCRFILAVVNQEIELRNRKREDLVSQLKEMGFVPKSSLRVTLRKEAAMKASAEDANASGDDEDVDDEESNVSKGTEKSESGGKKFAKSEYDYLLKLPLWSLTLERAQALKEEYDEKSEQRRILHETSERDMYLRDLDTFMEELVQWEINETNELETGEDGVTIQTVSKVNGRRSVKKGKVAKGPSKPRPPRQPRKPAANKVKAETGDSNDRAAASVKSEDVKGKSAAPKPIKTETIDQFFSTSSTSSTKPSVKQEVVQPPAPVKPERLGLFDRLHMKYNSGSSGSTSSASTTTTAPLSQPKTSPVKKETKPSPVKKETKPSVIVSDKDDDDDVVAILEEKKKPTASRSKKATTSSSSTTKSTSRKPASRKKKVIDSDDDDDFVVPDDDDDDGAMVDDKKPSEGRKLNLRTRTKT